MLGAVGSVNGEIAQRLVGPVWHSLAEIDAALIALDGTPGKGRLGANAVIGVSMACARALAAAEGPELWEWLSPHGVTPRLPVPHFNVINSTLRVLLAEQGQVTPLGDEGGFAPQLAEPEDVLSLLVTAITAAGYPTGRDGVAIALDPASTEFRRDDGLYHVAGQKLTSTDMIERYVAITERFPVWLIEDGLAEDDWDGWAALTDRLGDRVQLVGDDIFVTSRPGGQFWLRGTQVGRARAWRAGG